MRPRLSQLRQILQPPAPVLMPRVVPHQAIDDVIWWLREKRHDIDQAIEAVEAVVMDRRASAIEARSDETRHAAQPEGRVRGGEAETP